MAASRPPSIASRSRPISTASVVIPIYNEEENVAALTERLFRMADQLPHVRFQFVFVNDGSRDRSAELLDDLAEQHEHVTVLQLSRNFGHQHAVTAGMDYAHGDVVCLIDADLQDPPELLPPMIREIESGWDIVYGQRTARKGESAFKRASAALFYRVLRSMTLVDIPADTGDFRVMSRLVVDSLAGMREKHRFLRGMTAWVGFRSKAFPYVRDVRYAGVTKYPFLKMLRLARNAIFSFSDLPLRLANYLGLLLTTVAMLGVLYVVVLKLVYGEYLPGVSAVLLAVLLLGGVQLISMGILGEYVGRIFEQVKDRPLYLVAHVRNAERLAPSRSVFLPSTGTPPGTKDESAANRDARSAPSSTF